MRILLLLFLWLPKLYSQNGGQANQNDLIRIDYAGYSGNSHIFKITNIQRCLITAQYTSQGYTIQSVGILPYESFYYHIQADQSTQVSAKAKTTTYCNGPVPDRGWVEAYSIHSVLSTKFKNIKAKRIGSKIELTFEASESSSLTHYVIKISRDGINFEQVAIIFREGILPENKYKIIL